jgi:hypothetical protein
MIGFDFLAIMNPNFSISRFQIQILLEILLVGKRFAGEIKILD